MSEKKVWDALGEIDGALIEEVGNLLSGERKSHGRGGKPGIGIALRIGVMAAVAALVVSLGSYYRRTPEMSSMQLAEDNVLVQRAFVPERPKRSGEEADGDKSFQKKDWDSASASWRESQQDTQNVFYEASIREVLMNHAGENIVYSPVNLYLALGMLSEMSSGNTQREILTVMGRDSLEKARESCRDIWSRLCWKDNIFQHILGHSIWMGQGISYSEEAVKTLAEQHYVSSFQGSGGEEREQAMEDWLSDFLMPVPHQNRGGEVSQSAFELLSVIAFGEEWCGGEGFEVKGTEEGIFYQKDGREREVSFLRGVLQEENVTEAERYCSIDLGLTGGSCLSLYLPEKGVDLEEVLRKDLQSIVMSGSRKGEREDRKEARVEVLLPKFEVEASISLNAELKKMGLADIFREEEADFSPMLGETTAQEALPSLGGISQSARVILDERGCGTEAHGAVASAGKDGDMEDDGQQNEKKIICNQPFFYIVWNQEDTPVLAGIIHNFDDSCM